MSTGEFAWTIEKLRKKHVREHLFCGNPTLDDFLKTFARQNDSRSLGRTYVTVRSKDPQVAGYYTVAAGAIKFEVLPDHLARSLPCYPLPVLLLARLAVDLRYQRQGLHVGLLVEQLQSTVAVLGLERLHPVVDEQPRKREGRAHVVVHDEDLLAL